jgi:hypothetical protein
MFLNRQILSERQAPPAKLEVRSTKKSTESPRTSLQVASRKLGAQPTVFIETKGQFDSRAKFQVKSNGPTLCPKGDRDPDGARVYCEGQG